ncbi:twin-arginine translocase TatA/TatE family subunit [Zavarzinia compransoris]|uniref:Sec-independent protein translocase protein TatA n=1 Tax=Zavarzinia compransoris TaxID=1264899 RepID=A0A317EBM1_9PROT|nr:twin-arginine translocase TatA/TatE family subunit [Zavarzinia compransoris]PWR23664.1 twin-arginine translocase TatA/TatE family subunit [Zavarzinia compransoris]TDP47882.1 sec-independent protein translocase protein TatA [Zavarzinia compransoris]
MGAMSLWHWLIVIALVVLLFGGRGKISELMGDVAKGVKSFKKGLSDDPNATPAPPAEAQRPVTTIDAKAEPVKSQDAHKV